MVYQNIDLKETNLLEIDTMEVLSSYVIAICYGQAKVRELYCLERSIAL